MKAKNKAYRAVEEALTVFSFDLIFIIGKFFSFLKLLLV